MVRSDTSSAVRSGTFARLENPKALVATALHHGLTFNFHFLRVASSIVQPTNAVAYDLIKRDILRLHPQTNSQTHVMLLGQTRSSHKIEFGKRCATARQSDLLLIPSRASQCLRPATRYSGNTDQVSAPYM
jgi:hypothetical protein